MGTAMALWMAPRTASAQPAPAPEPHAETSVETTPVPPVERQPSGPTEVNTEPEVNGSEAQLRRELEALRAEVEELKRSIAPKEPGAAPTAPGAAPVYGLTQPGAAPPLPPGTAPGATVPVPARPAPPKTPPPPLDPVVSAVPSGWAAPLSARGPFKCLTRWCEERRDKPRLPAISTQVGRGVLSLNLYADFGYAVGPQGKHKYYDYITKREVEDYGRRDYTSYPLYANQFALAYGYVQGQYEIPNKLRLRIAFHTGHIVESLYNEEPKSLQLIREAALYYFFHPKLAIEAGILPSYYGAEIVLNKENLHATRAYIADFTPDYEAGVRLHYHFRKDMTLRFMVLNGWQEIRDANGRKGYGFVWSVFKPYKIVGDWTMYWGNEAALGEKTPVFRHYQNLYYRIWVGRRWLLFPMFDFVMQKNNTTNKYDFVVSPAFSLRFALTEKIGVAARYEYLHNQADIVPELKTGTKNGWQSHSGTGTLEYLPLPQLTLRLEGRYGVNKDAVFRNRLNMPVREDWYVYLGAAFHF